jgi:RHS repeat-associated protein
MKSSLILFSVFFINSTNFHLVNDEQKPLVTFADNRNEVSYFLGSRNVNNNETFKFGFFNELIDYADIINPDNYSINKNLAVGKTNGYLTVENTASYDIPIDIPSGTNGLTPNVSFNYNSRITDGFMGIGWGLDGLSSITRVNKTLYHDGQSDAIRGTLADKYALNGKRLIVVVGTYGADNSSYRTEINEFSKIVAYGSTGKGPQWFKVYAKSGLIYEFGNTTDSKVYNDQGCIISWQVNKISDRNNNYIKFNYLVSDDQRPISSIEYTGNNSLSLLPFAEIIFNYKCRSDISSFCCGGKIFTRGKLLDNVEVRNNGQLFKKYILSYILESCSQLQKITEYSSQNVQLNPTSFSWTRQLDNFTQTTNYSGSPNQVSFAGDFNGDGRDDLVTVPDKQSYSDTDKWKLYLSDANGLLVYSSEGNLNSRFETFIVGDFDGDCRTDLMMQENFCQPDYPNEKKYFFYQSVGTTFDRKVYYYTCYNNENMNVVDYNGDGELEFLYHDDATNWYLYTYSGNSIINTSLPSNALTYIMDEGIPNDIVDFNGDGCSDLLQLMPDGYKIFEFKGATSSSILIGTYQGTDLNEFDFRILGDFNGDGSTDIIKKSNAGWSMLVLTSQGFQSHPLTCFNNFDIDKNNNRFYAEDINGDNKADVIIVGRGQNLNNSYENINVALSSGDDFNLTQYTSQMSMQNDSDHYFNFGDFNGDGRSELFYNYNLIFNLFSFGSGTPSHLINSIIDGYGARIRISYLPMSNDNIYTRWNETNYQLKDYSSSLQLVYQVQRDNEVGSANTTIYHYEGAKMHKRGKGFVGFSRMTETNDVTGISTEKNFSFDDTFFYPQLVTVFNRRGSLVLSTISNTWSKINVQNKYCYPYISSVTQTDNLKGLNLSSSSSFDSYGNPTTISTNYGIGHTQTLSFGYNDERINDWLIGRPTTITKTSVKDGQTNTFTITRSYLATSNLPDIDIYNSGDPSYWQYDRDYDSFGNLWKEHVLTTGLNEIVNTYYYDVNGVNIVKKTDQLGNETNYTWYPANNLLQTQTDHFGNVATCTYNTADQLNAVSSLDQISMTISSSMSFTEGPTNALYYLLVTRDDGSQVKKWYNKLGHEICSEVKGFDGTMIKKDYRYNIKGQLTQFSEPTTGIPSQWNLINFDDFGRISSKDPFFGPTDVISYSGATITKSINNKSFSSTINSAGLITTCTDPGGSIVYDYFPDGLIKTIQASDGAIISFTYDKNGNRLTMNDPSAGVFTNSYFGSGQLKTTQNGRGQTTTYYYQPNGLLDYYVTVEGTTDFSYNSKGQVNSVSSPGGVTRTYEYDIKGRVSAVSESAGSVSNSVSFTYDSKGRLYRKYFNGTTDYEQFDYNANGYLCSIGFNGITVWQLNSMDEYFRIRQATIGTTQCSWNYDSNNMLSQINATGVQQYNYSFNVNTGNLTSRTNYLKNLSESFTYDSNGLDRLTNVTGPQNLTISYDSKGNIQNKSDAGTYSYDETPYAVTGITGGLNISSIPQNIEYFSFEKVKRITQGTKTADFIYNADNQRILMVTKENGVDVKSHWYFGSDYERENSNGVITQYIWIGGDPYTAVSVARKTGNGEWVIYNIFRDHLGTITHLKGINGVYEYSFDSWGRRRDKDTWSYNLDNEPALFADRGFTSHEYLSDFNLYNMNGRLYDPVIGRFLSPDIYVQRPDFTQSYNRYSYCFNNPLSYVDPSGYEGDDFWDWLFGRGCKTPKTDWTWWSSVKSRVVNFIRRNSNGDTDYDYVIMIYGGDLHLNEPAFTGGGGGGGGSSTGNGSNGNQNSNRNNSRAGVPLNPAGGEGYTPILYPNQSEGLRNLVNGCFEDNNPNNRWRYERLAFITRAGIVVLPGSGDGWSNKVTRCEASLIAAEAAGVIFGNYILVDGRILTIEGSIHVQPSCNQLVAIGNIEFCDMIIIGPSGEDARTLSCYGNYFVYDFNTPDIIYEGRGQDGDVNYGCRKLPYSTNLNFNNYLGY